MLMSYDIRGALVSIAASLKLRKRGRYGALDSQAADKVQKLSERIKNCSRQIDEFALEMLPGPGQAAASRCIPVLRQKAVNLVSENLIPDLPSAS